MSDPADLHAIIEAQAEALRALRGTMRNLAELTNDVMILRAALVSALGASPDARNAVLARLAEGPATLFQPGEELNPRYRELLQGRMAALAGSIRQGAAAASATTASTDPVPDVPDA